MIDVQQVFQTLYRNNQQISLLQANNDQLLELLMHAGALDAARSLGLPIPPAGQPPVPMTQAHITRLELPAVAQAKPKRGRPPNQPGRLDTLGRRIPFRKKAPWTPDRRAKMEAAVERRRAEQTTWTKAQREKFSKAMKEAARRKKALGPAYKTKVQLAAEARAQA